MKKMMIAAVAVLCGAGVWAAAASQVFNNLNAKQTTIKDGVITVKNIDGRNGGARLVLTLNQKSPAKIVYSGESKCTSCTGLKDRNSYSLYMDVTFMDGSCQYGIIACFDPKKTDWQKVSKVFMPKKPVKEARLYALFRNCKGEAQFRNIVLKEVK